MERRKEIREWIGALGQGTATVAVLISLGALLAARDANDATKTAASNQFTLAQQGQAADRFTQAVSQIGNPTLDIRLGGLYALQSVARQSPEYRQAARNLFAAYLRTHAPLADPRCAGTPAGNLPHSDFYAFRPAEDARVAMTILADPIYPLAALNTSPSNPAKAVPDLGEYELNRLWDSGATPPDLQSVCMANVDATGARLREAQLQGADLRAAKLSYADLRQAQFSTWLPQETNIDEADFSSSHLEAADFRDVRRRNSDCISYANGGGGQKYSVTLRFQGANMTGARLDLALLTGANLSYAVLDRATVGFTSLANSSLRNASLIGVKMWAYLDLRETDLTGARLSAFSLPGSQPDLVPNGVSPNVPVLWLNRAKLLSADLRGLDLSQADLAGADLTGAQLDAPATLTGVHYDKHTVWPIGYAPPPSTARRTTFENDWHARRGGSQPDGFPDGLPLCGL